MHIVTCSENRPEVIAICKIRLMSFVLTVKNAGARTSNEKTFVSLFIQRRHIFKFPKKAINFVFNTQRIHLNGLLVKCKEYT